MPDNTKNEVITAQNLTKSFGTLTAVNGVDFSVRRGECFGLLGPNGAGKTSIARMIFGLSPLTSGKLYVLNRDITTKAREIKALLGVVAQDDNLDPELTVRENLLVYASYFRLSRLIAWNRAAEILDFMGLTEKADALVQELSGGLKRRLTIGRALINKPELLILDEPTTGLDPYARHIVWQRLRKLKENGTTMLLTTHYLEEASQLCDRLIVINNGSILDEGSPLTLIERHVGMTALELAVQPQWHETLLSNIAPWLKAYQYIGENLILYSEKGQVLADNINKFLAEHSVIASYQRIRSTNLEDVFLKLTGKTLADGSPKNQLSAWETDDD